MEDASENNDETVAPAPSRPGGVLLAACVAAALLAGVGLGYLLGRDGDGTARTSALASSNGDTADDVDLTLEATLAVYLDALVSHDWPRAHALMCADLSEQVTAGSLKRELRASEDRAGLLSGFKIASVEKSDGLVTPVEYILKFENADANVTASVEREGSQYRVCSFENTGGTGVFASDA